MKLGVSELCDRYNIKSRKSLYSRLDGLGISLDKDGNKSYATEEQVKLLDQQNEHLKNGGTLKNFVPTTIAEVTALKDTASHIHDTQHDPNTASIVETTQHTPQLSTQSVLLGDIVQNLSQAIAEKMQPVDPVWYIDKLEKIRAIGVAVPTSEIKALIGVKPRIEKGKESYERGSYTYIPDGKIGREKAWKVFRKTDNQVSYKVDD